MGVVICPDMAHVSNSLELSSSVEMDGSDLGGTPISKLWKGCRKLFRWKVENFPKFGKQFWV